MEIYWQDYRTPVAFAIVLHLLVMSLFVVQWRQADPEVVRTPQFVKAVSVQRETPRAPKPAAPVKPEPKVEKVPPKPVEKPKLKPTPKDVVKAPVKPAEKTISKAPAPVVKEPTFEELLARETQSLRKPPPVSAPATPASSASPGDKPTAAEQSEIDEYMDLIRASVEAVWERPAVAKRGMLANLRIRVLPGGEVIDVMITEGSGNDAFDRSAEKAVWKAGRLPVPADAALFDRYFRQFSLRFNPDDRL